MSVYSVEQTSSISGRAAVPTLAPTNDGHDGADDRGEPCAADHELEVAGARVHRSKARLGQDLPVRRLLPATPADDVDVVVNLDALDRQGRVQRLADDHQEEVVRRSSSDERVRRGREAVDDGREDGLGRVRSAVERQVGAAPAPTD